MQAPRLGLTAAAVALALSACGGGSGSSPTAESPSSPSAGTLELASKAFPQGLAISSPTEVDNEVLTQVAVRESSFLQSLARLVHHMMPSAVAQATPSSAFAARVGRIDSLLNGSTPVLTLIRPERLLETEVDAQCYGPDLKYDPLNHPNAGSGAPGSPGTTLPPGDLGLWNETEGSSTEACAAAQLNARMKGTAQRANQALRMLAVLTQKAAARSGGLPAAGAGALDLTSSMPAIPGLTWTLAQLEQTSANNFQSTIQASYTNSGTGVTHRIDLTMRHDSVTPAAVYNGLLNYAITGKYNGGNCPGSSGSHDVTWVGTLAYDRSSASQLDVSHRSGMYCGAGTTAGSLATDRGASFATDGQLDPASKLGGSGVGSGQGWGNNFSRFAASLNPSTEAGRYAYVWQAGPNDNHGRTLQVTLDQLAGTKIGVAHFGFGEDIAAPGSGLIKGMFCNWAGPGNSRTYAEYAQEQTLVQSAGTGVWTPQALGSSKILYAATNSCTDSSTTAWLDRNDDGTINASDTPVTITGAEANFLKNKGSAADITSALAFSLPSKY